MAASAAAASSAGAGRAEGPGMHLTVPGAVPPISTQAQVSQSTSVSVTYTLSNMMVYYDSYFI